LKADIEGGEINVLEGLYSTKVRPVYASFEASSSYLLAHLFTLGYRRFKLVDQAQHSSIRLPNPPLEGIYTELRFSDAHSGPFGNETTGVWSDVETVMREYISLVRNGKLTWHDFHAAGPEPRWTNHFHFFR
jgi:hypothetical protein